MNAPPRPVLECLLTVTLVACVVTSAAAQAPPAPAVAGLSTEQQRLALESFDLVWKKIRDQHWDPEFGGLDWDAVRAELEPRIGAATTHGEVTEILTLLVARVGESHFGIVPGRIYDELQPADPGSSAPEDADGSGSGAGSGTEADSRPSGPAAPARSLTGNGRAGLEVRVVDDQVLVWRVARGSPAAAAGIRPGWLLRSVDGKDLADTITRVQELGGRSALQIDLVRAVESRLRGRVGDTAVLSLEDGGGDTVARNLVLTPAPGKEARLGHMPPQLVETEYRLLDANVGYLRFNLFMGLDTPPFLERSITDSMSCRGIIIDLRGNPGGIGFMASGLAGWFLDEQGLNLGTMHTRQLPLNFFINPRVRTYTGPLAVLIDGCSGSTSEIFAQGMKDLKRARVFGTTSCGMALPSIFERLPNGDGFQYAVADYVSVGGHRIEGQGVEPDEKVTLERKSLLAGKDPVLEAALRWIESQPSKD